MQKSVHRHVYGRNVVVVARSNRSGIAVVRLADLPATPVVSFDLGDDLDAFAGLAEDVADVDDVLRTADERRKDNVDLRRRQTHTHTHSLSLSLLYIGQCRPGNSLPTRECCCIDNKRQLETATPQNQFQAI